MTRLLTFLLIALCSPAFGQYSSTAQVKQILSGIDGQVVVGSYTFVNPGSQPKLESVGVIEITAPDGAAVLVRASDQARAELTVQQIADGAWMLRHTGRAWVETSAVWIDMTDPTKPKPELKMERFVLDIGQPAPVPPGPTPPGPVPPGPAPDIPPDAFDNIGQRVAQWTAGATMNKQVGLLYSQYATKLRTSPATINDISGQLAAELTKVADYDRYITFRTNLNADIKGRWPLSKGVLADYWDCVALGLGVKNANP